MKGRISLSYSSPSYNFTTLTWSKKAHTISVPWWPAYFTNIHLVSELFGLDYSQRINEYRVTDGPRAQAIRPSSLPDTSRWVTMKLGMSEPATRETQFSVCDLGTWVSLLGYHRPIVKHKVGWSSACTCFIGFECAWAWVVLLSRSSAEEQGDRQAPAKFLKTVIQICPNWPEVVPKTKLPKSATRGHS